MNQYKYLLFAGDDYYPVGGIKDFVAGYNSIEEAEAYAVEKYDSRCEWWHIVDTETLKIVKES